MPIPDGAAFNVVVIPSASPWIYTHITTAADASRNYSLLDGSNPGVRQPDSMVFVTPSYDPTGVYNGASPGVWYTGTVWSVFNEGLELMPMGTAFNIWVIPIP